MLLVLNLPLAPLWARVMLIPRSLLFGGILVLASVGAYSLNRSLLDLVLLYIVGAVGCAMRVQDIPLVPAVMGLFSVRSPSSNSGARWPSARATLGVRHAGRSARCCCSRASLFCSARDC